jgi:fatty acid desaturase
MVPLPVITDPVYVKREFNWFDKQLLRIVRDERDLPFIYLLLKITLVLLPMAIMLYTSLLPNWAWWLLAVVYQVVNFIFRAPFGLMMHCISHRQLFKRKYKGFYYYIIWFLGPFLGHTPETYFSHHIGMHHAENNMPEDRSSTMYYQRDSLKDFFRYLGHFLTLGLKDLITYLFARNKKKLAHNAMAGEFTYFVFCIGMCFVNLDATLAVFVVTFVISRMIMMVGNWTQHSFIDPSDPANPYKNGITTLNVNYNKRCWNDGYHSSHHARPALHWTEHPVVFQQTLDEYSSNKAIVFDRLDFGGVFLCLMTKNYDKLAKHLVNVNDVFQSDEEVIAILQERTKKFPEEVLQSGNYQTA